MSEKYLMFIVYIDEFRVNESKYNELYYILYSDTLGNNK